MYTVRARRRAARVGLVAAAGVVGCGDATGPAAADVEGTYILERVDGRVVEDGESTLSFSARAGETAPLYGWNVREAPTHTFDSDVGIWRMDGRRVRFRSQRGLGTYAATPEPVTDGAIGGPRLTVRGHGGAGVHVPPGARARADGGGWES